MCAGRENHRRRRADRHVRPRCRCLCRWVHAVTPYLNRPSDKTDTARYQTVFAREPGAVAAPTAGLHFTSEALSQIPHTFVTLHVGPGTFLPVRSEHISEHRMHAERFSIAPDTADKINHAQLVLAV